MSPVTVEYIRNYLQATYNFGAEQVEAMISILTQSLNLEFINADNALAQNDITALIKASHSIKGALSNAGITEWSELARKIELSAKDGENRNYEGLIQELKNGVNAIL